MDKSAGQNTRGIVTKSTRWLAVAAGCFTAVTGTISVGGLFFVAPIFLILGVVFQPRARRLGRWLIWVGAAFLNLMALPQGIVLLPEYFKTMHIDPHYQHDALRFLIPLWVVSLLLILWCDLALVIDAVKTSRSRIASEMFSPDPADWMVRITALLFSVYSFWGIPFLLRAFNQGFDRLDILLTALALILIALVFDIALAIDAAKMWRARRTAATGSR